VIRGQEAFNFGLGRVGTRTLGTGANSEITRNTRRIFRGSRLPHIDPNSAHADVATPYGQEAGLHAQKRAFDASGRDHGLIFVLHYSSMFTVISFSTLSGKNRLGAGATWSAMHGGHLFFFMFW
jgi:hypothetical protein